MKLHAFCSAVLLIFSCASHLASAGDISVLMGKDNSGAKICPTNVFTIATNETLTLDSLTTFGVAGLYGNTMGPSYFGYVFTKDSFRITNDFSNPVSFPGPGELEIIFRVTDTGNSAALSEWRNNSGALIHLKSTLQNYPPDKTYVIPAGSPGGIISVEGSTDLADWRQVPPGTYTTPTNHMFFRLKLQRIE